MLDNRTKALDVLIVAALGATGFALALAYGRLGYMPLDQSIVFDGGWRVLSGQAPFRDFTTPAGLTPIYLQALAFWAFGVSWLTYIAHAAAVNGAFCVLAYLLLRGYGLSRAAAAIYAASSAVLLYPPIGTPYPDQHGFFFLFVSVCCLRAALRSGAGRTRSLLGVLAGFAWILCLWSKITIAGFGLLALLTISFADRSQRAIAMEASLHFLAGCLFAVGLSAVVWGLTGAQPKLFQTYFLELPFAAGSDRLANLIQVAVTERMTAVFPLGRAIIVLALVSAVAWRSRRSDHSVGAAESANPVAPLSAAVALVVVCDLYSATTYNQPENSVPYFFVALGLVHAGLAMLPMDRLHPRAAASAAAILVALTLFLAYTFQRDVNATRLVLDIDYSQEIAVAPATPALEFMSFQVPDKAGIDATDIDQVVEFFREREGDFFLVGDASILYGLTGRPSIFPALWYHPNLTIPPPETTEIRELEMQLMRDLEEREVRFFVFEGQETWMGFGLQQLPIVTAALRIGVRERWIFGGFTVVRVDLST